MTQDGRASPLPPRESFGYNLRMANRLIQRDLSARLVRLGIGMGQWYALRTLWQGDGLTQIELAQRSGIAGPAMVVAVRSLLESGLVTRERPEGDRRKYVIRLTERGWALEREALEAAREANALALTGVEPADVAACLRVLHAAQENLSRAVADEAVPEDAEAAILRSGL